ncbi:MAG: sensor histidine kinase [Spirochaetia bacterium]
MGNKKEQDFYKLRQYAENLLKDAQKRPVDTGKNLVDLVEELHIHQVELELQNQQLRETTHELEVLKQEYFDIYKFAPCGYLTLNGEMIITRANLTAVKLLNLDQVDIIGRSLESFVFVEFWSLYQEAVSEAQSGKDQHMRLLFTIPENEKRWFHTDIRLRGGTDDGEKQYFVTLTDITEQVEAKETLASRTREVERLLKEKELLMRESNHRIKNDIHVIGSFLELQMISADSEKTREGLLKAQNMVNTMGRIYEMLSSKKDITWMNASELLQNVIGDVSRLTIPGKADLEVSLEDVMVTSKAAVSLGLILNEILTNAAKYAVPKSENPAVSIILKKAQPDIAELIVSDNGPGIPEEMSGGAHIGTGLGLVQALTQQLGGELDVRNPGGARIRIRFPCGASSE